MPTIIDGWKRRASKNAVLITVLESLKGLVQLKVQENAEFSWESFSQHFANQTYTIVTQVLKLKPTGYGNVTTNANSKESRKRTYSDTNEGKPNQKAARMTDRSPCRYCGLSNHSSNECKNKDHPLANTSSVQWKDSLAGADLKALGWKFVSKSYQTFDEVRRARNKRSEGDNLSSNDNRTSKKSTTIHDVRNTRLYLR